MILGVLVPQTKQELMETVLWLSQQGGQTAAVKRAILARTMTFGIALITRHTLGGGDVGRN